jgi:hypothetical protein
VFRHDPCTGLCNNAREDEMKTKTRIKAGTYTYGQHKFEPLTMVMQ